MKKILIFVLLTVIFAVNSEVSAITVVGSSFSSPTQAEIQQLYSVRKYEQFLEDSSKYASFDAEFGGAYLDGGGNLVVNVVRGNKEKFTNGLGLDSDIIVNEVDYSYQQLYESQKILENYMSDLNMTRIYISVQDNAIVVDLVDNYEINKSFIQQLSLVDNLIINEYDDNYHLVLTTDYYMGNGDAITSNGQGFTSGVAAENSDGDDGFITVGHVNTFVDPGDSVYVDGIVAGYYRQSSFQTGGRIDGAFVELKYTWFVHWYSTHELIVTDYCIYPGYSSVAIVPGYLLVGLIVTSFGGVTGMTEGQIQATDVAYQVDNVTISHAVQANYMSLRGDSGAPVTYWVWTGGSTCARFVMGIQSAALLSYPDYNWIPGVSYSIFTRVDYIAIDLDITYV